MTPHNQEHTDCSYGYKVVCCHDNQYSKPTIIYRGERAVYKFMQELLKEVEECKNIAATQFNKPRLMTHEDEADYAKASECHMW